MEKSKLAAAVLVIVFAAYLFFHVQKMQEIGFNWLSPQRSDEIYLTSYPKLVSGGGGAFSVHSSFAAVCSLCGTLERNISAGENVVSFDAASCKGIVSLTCSGRAVSFSFQYAESVREEYANASTAFRVENRTLFATVAGDARTNGYRPLEIHVDGHVVSSPLHYLNGSFNVTESVALAPGTHDVSVKFLGTEVGATRAHVPAPYPFTALAAVILSLALAFALRTDALTKALAASLLVTASLVATFVLAGFGAEWCAPLALAVGLVLARGTKRKTSAAPHSRDGNERFLYEAALFGVAFAAIIAAYAVLMSSYDVWGAYYFRHVEETVRHATTDYVDALSYLGRPFTYPPLFFEFAAQLTNVLAAPSFESIRVPLDIVFAFFFAATTYLLFRKFEPRRRLLASLLFVSQWALLGTASGIGLHIFAFTLLNAALLLAESSIPAAAAALGMAFAAHPLALAFFPVYHYALNGFKLDWKRIALIGIGAVLVSLPFYVPIFLRAGIPYEVVPRTWGYLLSYGLDGVRFDFQFLLPLLAGCALYGIWANRYRLASVLLACLLLVNAYVSLRSDLMAAMVGAALFPLVFEKEIKNRLVFLLLLALFIAPNFLLGAVVLSGTQYYCSWGLANDVCRKPMEYIGTYTPSSGAVALDPLYGHLEAWVGGRPVLADLYVEYADEKKLMAESAFAWEADVTALAPYNITIYGLHDYYKTPRALPQDRYDRVYDNGFLHFYRKA